MREATPKRGLSLRIVQLNRLTCQQSYSNFLILSVCRFKSKLVLTSGFPTTSSARLLNLRNPQQFGTSANLDNPLEVGILILLTPPAGESTLGCGLGLPRTGVQTPAGKPSAVASWPPAHPVLGHPPYWPPADSLPVFTDHGLLSDITGALPGQDQLRAPSFARSHRNFTATPVS